MKLGPILLLWTGGKALKEKSEFEQSGAIAEDIFITEGKSFNPTTNPTQTKNLSMTKIFKKPFDCSTHQKSNSFFRKSCISLTSHLYKYLTINKLGFPSPCRRESRPG